MDTKVRDDTSPALTLAAEAEKAALRPALAMAAPGLPPTTDAIPYRRRKTAMAASR